MSRFKQVGSTNKSLATSLTTTSNSSPNMMIQSDSPLPSDVDRRSTQSRDDASHLKLSVTSPRESNMGTDAEIPVQSNSDQILDKSILNSTPIHSNDLRITDVSSDSPYASGLDTISTLKLPEFMDGDTLIGSNSVSNGLMTNSSEEKPVSFVLGEVSDNGGVGDFHPYFYTQL